MLKIGHRGACGHEPENTLRSFRRAMELGVDGVELDVHICASGEPVVIHDETLERTTNGTGRVALKALAELKTFDAGKGERIPTLQEAINLIDRKIRIFIELKDDNAVAPVVKLIERSVKKGWKYEQLMIIAFNHHLLLAAKKLNPDIQTGALLVGIPATYAQCAVDAKAQAINPAVGFVNKAFVDDAHRRGLKVFCWTVNTPVQIAKARQAGVDGIMGDYPDRFAL